MSTATLIRPAADGPGIAPRARPGVLTRTLASTPGALFLGFLALYAAVGLWLVLVEHSVMEDALSRVSNASYVLYSREPKLANVGFVWTPLPSLLVLPFLPLKGLWPALVEQGLLANALSAIAMAACVRVLHSLLGALGVGRRLRLGMAIAFGLQPMIIWFGANGMTEALLLLFVLLTARALVTWRADGDPRHLMAAGAWLALGYLSRYETLAAGAAATVLVVGLTWGRTGGSRRERGAAAVNDAVLVAGPLAAAFLLWAVASWVIVGHPFDQFASEYGNSALVGSGTAGAGGTGLLVVQWLVLAPLLGVAALGAAYRAYRRRDPSLLAPVGLLVAVLLFEAAVYSAGSLFGFLRYQIAVIPLFFVLAGYLLAEAPSSPVVAVGRRPWAVRSRRGSTASRGGRTGSRSAWTAVAGTVAVLVPGVVSSGYAFMERPDLASQEWGHVRPAVLALTTGGDPDDGTSSNGAFEIDRSVAAYLDAERLPAGSVAVDSGSGFAVLAATENPEQFVITSDRDFQGAVIDPVGHGVRYLLLNRGNSQFDRIAATWPDLTRVAGEEPWARLDVVFPVDDAPAAHEWILWRVDPDGG